MWLTDFSWSAVKITQQAKLPMQEGSLPDFAGSLCQQLFLPRLRMNGDKSLSLAEMIVIVVTQQKKTLKSNI